MTAEPSQIKLSVNLVGGQVLISNETFDESALVSAVEAEGVRALGQPIDKLISPTGAVLEPNAGIGTTGLQHGDALTAIPLEIAPRFYEWESDAWPLKDVRTYSLGLDDGSFAKKALAENIEVTQGSAALSEINKVVFEHMTFVESAFAHCLARDLKPLVEELTERELEAARELRGLLRHAPYAKSYTMKRARQPTEFSALVAGYSLTVTERAWQYDDCS